MRIGMFTDCYKPVINGVVTSIEATIEYLRRRGHEVFLFAPGIKGGLLDEDEILQFYSLPFPFQREQRIAFPLPWTVFRKIGRLDLDIVHVHTPFAVGMMGRFWAKQQKIPLVYTHHTHFEEYIHYIPFSQKFLQYVAVELPKKFCRRSKAVIAPSKEIQMLLHSYGVDVPVHVWPSPISLNSYKNGNPDKVFAEFPQWRNGFKLLYVGRLAKEKGLELLLRSFQIIKNELPEAGLLLVGDGPQRQLISDLVREYGVEDSVWFAGYVPREEVCHYYTAADLFVFASQTETQGLVVVEAMAAGCPVVAVDALGVRDAFTDGAGGRLVSPEPNLFAKTVVDLLLNPEERSRQSALAEQEACRFSWDVLGVKLEEIYENAIRNNMPKVPKSKHSGPKVSKTPPQVADPADPAAFAGPSNVGPTTERRRVKSVKIS